MPRTKKQQPTPLNLEIFETDFDFYIQEYCELNKIEDLRKENNNLWCSVMIYLYKHCIKSKEVLKDYKLYCNGSFNGTTSNRYNYELIDHIVDIYINRCLFYCKDISIYSFSLLTGICQDTIYLWGNNNKYDYDINSNNINILDNQVDNKGYKLTCTPFSIYKKLHDGRQQCLVNNLSDSRKNPVGTIAILNHFYNWQTTATANGTNTQQLLSAENLPKLPGV